MKNIKRLLLLDLVKIVDIVLLLIASLFAAEYAHQLYDFKEFSDFIGVRLSLLNFLILSFMIFAWHMFFKYFGAYDARRFLKFHRELLVILKGVSISAFSIFALNLFIPFNFVTLTFLNVFWITGMILITFERIAIRFIQWYLRKQGKNLRFVLIAGTNNKALKLANRFLSNPDFGYKINGFIDENWEGNEHLNSNFPKIVSDFDSINNYLRNNPIDEIFVFLPIKTYYDQISQIVTAAEEQGILVRYSTDLFDLKLAQIKVEHFEGEPIMTLFTGQMYRKMILIKETFDFAVAAFIILLVSPILLFLALAIKISSPGPIFFTQNRLGVNKHLFKLIKFRTMIVDAELKIKDLEHLNERKGEATFKIKNDPRVTPIGKILRKTSLDELPQLFNVLLGDMSLVGPRPLPVRDYEGFDKDWQRRRFSVKPGITCTWQVSGRDKITFDEWMKMDMDYIDKWSLWLDMKLLFKTIPAVIFGNGAS